MLTVETIARVRREQARGKSVRAIARDLRLSRDTVTKYLRSGETEARYERHRQPYPQLGPKPAMWSAHLHRAPTGSCGAVRAPNRSLGEYRSAACP